jgi:hypothetical protein
VIVIAAATAAVIVIAAATAVVIVIAAATAAALARQRPVSVPAAWVAASGPAAPASVAP